MKKDKVIRRIVVEYADGTSYAMTPAEFDAKYVVPRIKSEASERARRAGQQKSVMNRLDLDPLLEEYFQYRHKTSGTTWGINSHFQRKFEISRPTASFIIHFLEAWERAGHLDSHPLKKKSKEAS